MDKYGKVNNMWLGSCRIEARPYLRGCGCTRHANRKLQVAAEAVFLPSMWFACVCVCVCTAKIPPFLPTLAKLNSKYSTSLPDATRYDRQASNQKQTSKYGTKSLKAVTV